MLIGTSFKGELAHTSELIEPKLNHEASSYIINNYQALLKFILSKNICIDKANDLLHDVYISIFEAESNGEGFDEDYGDGIMDVGNFVRGRIAGYASNMKYRSDIVDYKVSKVEEYVNVETVKTDINGNPILKRGKLQVSSTRVKVKKQQTFAVYSASGGTADNSDNTNDSFQTAYSVAAVSDGTDNIEEALSLREEIDACIDICDMYGFNILNVFRNIDVLDKMLASNSSKKKSADSIFHKLSALVAEHDVLAENIMNVLKFSAASPSNRALFESIIATY